LYGAPLFGSSTFVTVFVPAAARTASPVIGSDLELFEEDELDPDGLELLEELELELELDLPSALARSARSLSFIASSLASFSFSARSGFFAELELELDELVEVDKVDNDAEVVLVAGSCFGGLSSCETICNEKNRRRKKPRVLLTARGQIGPLPPPQGHTHQG
jgi:hypothetical protein